MFFTYILQSVKDGRYYYGSCADLNVRIKSHNGGKGRSTKSRRPLVLHYFETFETKTEVRKRELFFNSVEGYKWLKSQSII